MMVGQAEVAAAEARQGGGVEVKAGQLLFRLEQGS